jgi:hypothetical protein
MIRFANNAESTLAMAVVPTDTQLDLAPGTGTRFPALSGSDISLVTLIDPAETVFEIVQVTAISGDALTVVRGQESFSAKAWPAGTRVSGRVTAGMLGAFKQTQGVGLWLPTREITDDLGQPVAMVVGDYEVVIAKTVPSVTTVMLPEIVIVGQSHRVSDGVGDAAAYAITVEPQTGVLINSAANTTITTAFGSKGFRARTLTDWNALP